MVSGMASIRCGAQVRGSRKGKLGKLGKLAGALAAGFRAIGKPQFSDTLALCSRDCLQQCGFDKTQAPDRVGKTAVSDPESTVLLA
jgi:hypothetical protein